MRSSNLEELIFEQKVPFYNKRVEQVIKGQRIRASSQPLIEDEQAVLPHPSSSFSLNVDSFMSHQPNQSAAMTVDKRQEQTMDNCVRITAPSEEHNELFLEEQRRKTTLDMCEADFFITSTVA